MMLNKALFLLAFVVPLICHAREVAVSGVATLGSTGRPATGVNVTLLEPPGLLAGSVKTDQQGRFRMNLHLTEDQGLVGRSVALRFEGHGVHPINIIYRNCDLRTAVRCEEELVALPLLEDDGSAPNSVIGNVPQIPAGEYGLVLSPYEIVPPSSRRKIDTGLFASTMRRAINAHLTELGAAADLQGIGRLPLLDIYTTDRPLARASLHARRVLGEMSGAIAVIAGQGQWAQEPAGESIALVTDFLLMPPTPTENPLFVEIKDPSTPLARFSSLDLADQLSPLWKRYSLVALAEWELERAIRTGDRHAMDRVYVYVAEERNRLSGAEKARAAELRGLLKRIDKARSP